MAVRSSSGMKTSVARVMITSAPSSCADQLLEAERRRRGRGPSPEAAAADGAGVVAAVAGVDHDAARAEAELAGEAVGAGAVRWPAGSARRGSGRRAATRPEARPSTATWARPRFGPGRPRRRARASRAGGRGQAAGSCDRRAAPGSAAGRARRRAAASPRGPMPSTRPGAPDVGAGGAPCATCGGEGRGRCPRTSITRRVRVCRGRRRWCSQTSLKSRTTRTTSSLVLADPDLLEQAVADGEGAAARGSGGGGCRRGRPRAGRGSLTRSDSSSTFRSTSMTTRVEESPLQERRSKTRARPGGGRRGQRGRRARARASSALTAPRAGRVGEGVEVGAAGLGEPLAVAGLAGRSRRAEQSASSPRRLIGYSRHEHPVGLRPRRRGSAGELEALRHLAVEVARRRGARCRSSRSGGSGPRPCGSAATTAVPLGPLRAAARRGARARLGLPGPPCRARRRAAPGPRPRGAADGAPCAGRGRPRTPPRDSAERERRPGPRGRRGERSLGPGVHRLVVVLGDQDLARLRAVGRAR